MRYNHLENEFAKFWIRDDILFVEYKPNVVIDLASAQRIVADRVMVQNEKAYPVFCDIRGLVDSDKAARDYLSQSGSILTKAVSLVVHQSISLILTSYYLKICKPSVPTKLFTDEAAALAFLEPYI
ncbi:hypothetical protein [Flavobacterium frigoris]|jgi:hypothetical protein|uniref:DUF7793 domain-containing protein n=1 Tax=Flavobacterium frigoris (strain PS1) TaxID=1086011 RepID=H7FW66_FLAFP|nr:hypothetical protein [Flavobacterium frigoris]EIA07295.1 hypothetical protein HJ01_03413 [Flavobacterium frigoris PS1]